MDPDWNRLLGGISREKPPEIPIDRILDRSRSPQRPLYLVAAVALVALTLIASQFKEPAPDAPVHLQIDFVQASTSDGGRGDGVSGDRASGDPSASLTSDRGDDPEEFDRP